MITICICGGGSLGHVSIGMFGTRYGISVNLFTKRPQLWNKQITVTDPHSNVLTGKISKVSDNPEKVISDSDIVLLCVPGYLIESTLKEIKPYLKNNAIVGTVVSCNGFFFYAHDILGKDTPLFGYQRVPLDARFTEYGKTGSIIGYKKSLSVAIENVDNTQGFVDFLSYIYNTPTKLLNSFYEVSFTNSNPILHTGRIYNLFKNWDGETPIQENPLFYEDWTDEDSCTILSMDKEFMELLDKLPVDKRNIPDLLTHYESKNSTELTQKIKSIGAFKGIRCPLKQVENGYILDTNTRYFSEDFPYGLHFIKIYCDKYGINAPNISKVYNWGMKMINKRK